MIVDATFKNIFYIPSCASAVGIVLSLTELIDRRKLKTENKTHQDTPPMIHHLGYDFLQPGDGIPQIVLETW